ncbi:hypothetical protein Tco_0002453 [Tanacetum coccineum]
MGFTPRRRIGFRMKLVQGAMPICEGSCRLTFLEKQEVWNDCRSCKVRVGSNGNLLWEASVLYDEKKGGDDVAKTIFRMRNGHVEVYDYAFWVNQCTSGFHEVNEPGGVKSHVKMIVVSTEGEKSREVFPQRLEAEIEGMLLDGGGDGIKWVMSRSWHCRKEQTVS